MRTKECARGARSSTRVLSSDRAGEIYLTVCEHFSVVPVNEEEESKEKNGSIQIASRIGGGGGAGDSTQRGGHYCGGGLMGKKEQKD